VQVGASAGPSSPQPAAGRRAGQPDKQDQRSGQLERGAYRVRGSERLEAGAPAGAAGGRAGSCAGRASAGAAVRDAGTNPSLYSLSGPV
jgi:hypothetical protein